MSVSTTFSAALEARLPEKPDRYRLWKRLARLVALIAVVWMVATRVNVSDLGDAFTHVKPLYLAGIVFFLSPLVVLLRSLRWRYLLPGGKQLPLSSYVGAYLIGVLANSLLLGKVGDLVKARVICRTHLAYGRSLAVVVIDRLLEGLGLLFIFALVLSTSPLPAWTHRLAWVASLASLAMLAALRLLASHGERLDGLAGSLASYLPASIGSRLVSVLRQLRTGCQVLKDSRRVMVVVLYGLVVWVVEITAVTVFLKALLISAPWLIAAPLLVVVLNFGMLIPISPGSVGVYQLLCAFALSFWGVSHQAGLALGVVMQTILYVPLCLAGGFWLLALGRKKREEAVPSAAG